MKSNKLYERALITCIIMLFICILFKLFGFNYFNLNTDIPILKEIDNVVMNSTPLSFLYSFILTSISVYVICSIILKDKKPNIIMMVITVFVSILYTSHLNSFYTLLMDTLSILLICFVSDRKLRFNRYIIVIILNVVYQLLSLFIRNVNISVSYHGLVTTVLLNLDYYILLIITYLLLKGDYIECLIKAHSGSSLANLLWKKRSENYSNKKGK